MSRCHPFLRLDAATYAPRGFLLGYTIALCDVYNGLATEGGGVLEDHKMSWYQQGIQCSNLVQ